MTRELWGDLLVVPPRISPGEIPAAASRVLAEPDLVRSLHTVHLSPYETSFLFVLPRASDDRDADAQAFERAVRNAWLGVPPKARDEAQGAR